MFILLYQTNKKYILCRLKKGTIAIRFFSQNLVRNNQFHTGDKPYEYNLRKKAFNQKNSPVMYQKIPKK